MSEVRPVFKVWGLDENKLIDNQ